MHARAVGVEDAHDLDLQPVLAVIVEEQRFGAALALIIAGARTDRIDVAPIGFRLGMDSGIAIDLARRGLQDLRLEAFGQAQHVDGAVDGGFRRLHRIMLVMDRRRRTGEIVDLINLDIEREAHIVAHELEARMGVQVIDIALGAGEQIVDAQHFVALIEQPVGQVRSQEAGTACHEDPLSAFIKTGQFRVSKLSRANKRRHCCDREWPTSCSKPWSHISIRHAATNGAVRTFVHDG